MHRSKAIVPNIIKTLLLPAAVYAFFLVLTLALNKQAFGTNMIAMKSMLQQSVFGLIVALAFSMHLLSGRIDFSMGAVIILAAIIGGNIAVKLDAGPYGLLLFCTLSAVVLSLITGILYIVLRIPPLIVTLAMLLIYEAISAFLFGGKGIMIYGNEKMTVFARWPHLYLLALISMVGFYFVLTYTRFGHDMRSLANGQHIAINIGVNEKRNVILTFIIAGFFIGIAATVFVSVQGQARPASSMSSTAYMFAAFTPVIIGMYLARFSNIPIGIFVASITMGLLQYGLVSIGVHASLQNVVSGIFLVLFIGITSNQQYFIEHQKQKKRAQQLNINLT